MWEIGGLVTHTNTHTCESVEKTKKGTGTGLFGGVRWMGPLIRAGADGFLYPIQGKSKWGTRGVREPRETGKGRGVGPGSGELVVDQQAIPKASNALRASDRNMQVSWRVPHQASHWACPRLLYVCFTWSSVWGLGTSSTR